MGSFKPEPLPVEPSGAPDLKKHYHCKPSRPSTGAKEQPEKVVVFFNTLVEVHKVMLHTKYQGSCGFRPFLAPGQLFLTNLLEVHLEMLHA